MMARILTDGAELGGYSGDINAAYLWRTHGLESSYGMRRSSTVKRSGDYSWQWITYNLTHRIYISPSPGNEVYLRFGLRFGYYTNTAEFFFIGGPSTSNGIGFDRNGGDKIRFRAPWTTPIYTEYLAHDTWYLMELHLKLTNPGVAEWKVDGNLVYSSSSVTFIAEDIWRFQCWTNQNNQNFWIDDIAINDTSGSYNNSWIGDGHVVVIKPNAAGDITQLLSSTGNPNYQNVDDVPFDATGNNSGSTAGLYDLYNFESCGLANVGFSSVNVIGMGKAETDDGLACKTIIKTSGSEAEDDGVQYLRTGDWDYIMGDCHAKKPDGSDWTVADIDAIQGGFKIADG